MVHGLKKFYNVSIEYDFTFYVMNNQKICNYGNLICPLNCAFTPNKLQELQKLHQTLFCHIQYHIYGANHMQLYATSL